MALVNTLLLQASSKPTIISYICPPILTTPIIITGTGIEDMLSADDIEGAMMEVGTDGTLSVHVKPAFVKFKLTLQPQSTALNAFITVMKAQYLIGAGIPGSIIVANAPGVWEVTYQNVIITTQFKGFENAAKVKDVPISFSAQLPTTTIIGDILSVLEALTPAL